MFHHFNKDISSYPIPDRFTFPFHYTPHPLCLAAASQLQEYLKQKKEWKTEIDKGKMFGVLVVSNQIGELGFVAAFSGILAGENIHPYFVPPIYDLLRPDGFFRNEEAVISSINNRITSLLDDQDYRQSVALLNERTTAADICLEQARLKLKEEKEKRQNRRNSNQLSDTESQQLIRQSQFQKAEFKRLEKNLNNQLQLLKDSVAAQQSLIEALRQERRNRSARLQMQLFDQFQILNAKGESRGLCSIFEKTAQKTPPAGAGECAAPKMLQYAFRNNLHPVAMAEFWWGESPKTEIRHHLHFYPACKGKCEPILGFMLQGLNVEANPLHNDLHSHNQLEIVFEDEFLAIINKPSGLLSVNGKAEIDSVEKKLHALYPQASGPMIVHRLDMATSGLLLIAKNKDVHKLLQAEFLSRNIKKRYVALLDGIIRPEILKNFETEAPGKGLIQLSMAPDYFDRPRQIIDNEKGKPAITRFEILSQNEGYTRIVFFPLTGRTHQLRVTAAHSQGLHCPIKGDELYGRKADRLYLHAESLDFRHPVTGKMIHIEKKADF